VSGVLSGGVPIEAVLCDLDDTLYPQEAWLDGAWRDVARAGAEFGIEYGGFLRALREVASEGSARGGIIDRALVMAGAGAGVPVGPLVEVFLAHRPVVLEPYPGVREALARLRGRVALGIVTDGNVAVQEGKFEALGLRGEFGSFVVSDRLGREFRKPHGAPFWVALGELGVKAERAVYIGDRVDKDVVGALGVGLRAVRVLTGEYAQVGDSESAPVWFTAGCFAEAVEGIVGHLAVRSDGG
jgi:putative hydrolase of the HAD superfamily